jgi:hypothetical protein
VVRVAVFGDVVGALAPRLTKANGYGLLPTAAQLCLAFSLSRPSVASACFGAKSTLAEDLGSLAVAGRLGPAICRLEADTGQPADRHRD